jgi:hypothetical protein
VDNSYGLCNCFEFNSIFVNWNLLKVNMEHILYGVGIKTMVYGVFISNWQSRSDMLDLNMVD